MKSQKANLKCFEAKDKEEKFLIDIETGEVLRNNCFYYGKKIKEDKWNIYIKIEYIEMKLIQ